MNNYKRLEVYFYGRKVGTLAKAGRYQVAFEYAAVRQKKDHNILYEHLNPVYVFGFITYSMI